MNTVVMSPLIMDRMVRAVEKVRERMLRVGGALNAAGIPYAIIGGNAVGAWVATVNEEAVRNTKDVDILLDQSGLERAKEILRDAGFFYHHAAGLDFFRDGQKSKFADSVHVILGGKKVRQEYATAAPTPDQSVLFPAGVRILNLASLLTMKLTSFRLKDQVHILDLIGVGLVDESFMDQVPEVLRPRLRQMLDSPEIERTPEGVDDPD